MFTCMFMCTLMCMCMCMFMFIFMFVIELEEGDRDLNHTGVLLELHTCASRGEQRAQLVGGDDRTAWC